jgi:uncharacterized protein (TIGR02271 family)
MQHTLIAVFDNQADAERARDDLLMAGFKRDCVKMSNSDPTGMTDSVSGSTTVTDTEERHEGLGASIKHFFSDIFGTDNSEHAQRYEDAVTRGHHVLTVTTDSEPEVERAADVVERHGPVDIDEKHSEWSQAAGLNPEAMRASGAGGLQQSSSMSRQSGSLGSQQSELGSDDGDRNLFAQQSLNDDVPMGQTYQEPLGRSGQSLQGSSLEGSALQSPGTTGSMQGSKAGDITRGTSLAGDSLTGSQQRDTSLSGSRQRETSAAIPVVQEDLKIGKREVQRGGVRIFSRVVETPVNESIGLREEHVNVERQKVDRPLSGADSSAFKEQTIEMRESAEEAVVEKSARVVEEVKVGKQVSERQQKISDTVRHTEVEVQKLGAESTVRSGLLDDDDYYRKDWNSKYATSGGSYDDYKPAYSYGSEMAGSQRYKGRKWDDVESDLRSDWDTRYPGGATGSTWERMKAAVRHGWDRMTGSD